MWASVYIYTHIKREKITWCKYLMENWWSAMTQGSILP